jgi:hypothetical protein
MNLPDDKYGSIQSSSEDREDRQALGRKEKRERRDHLPTGAWVVPWHFPIVASFADVNHYFHHCR